jgi:hypothetical protein
MCYMPWYLETENKKLLFREFLEMRGNINSFVCIYQPISPHKGFKKIVLGNPQYNCTVDARIYQLIQFFVLRFKNIKFILFTLNKHIIIIIII